MSRLDRAAACWQLLRQRAPLVHCILGPVSMRDCANLLLAAGARPIMAQAPAEAAEIAARADALLLNTGTLSDSAATAMQLAGQAARDRGIPIVLDLVGIGLSPFRNGLCHSLIREVHPALLKGNGSEIRSLLYGGSAARGVDAADADSPTAQTFADGAAFAARHGATLLLTGEVDYIITPESVLAVQGGRPLLASITASGCMCGALCAALLPWGDGTDAVLAAVTAMGLAAESAAGAGEAPLGPGTFGVRLLDQIHLLNPARIADRKELVHENPL